MYNRLPRFFDLIQPPCGPGVHFSGERNVSNNEIVKIQQQQQAAANNPRVFVWKNQPKKMEKRTSWSRIRYENPGAWYVSHEGNLRQPTTNKLQAGPAAKGRDNEGHMCRSHASSVLSRRATSAAPAQRKNYRSSRWDHENKSRISETPRPGRYTKIK